tara:strand:+ start:14574 stop:14927 length:354 start_codon:yes stop_codon:yes gene_type:complete
MSDLDLNIYVDDPYNDNYPAGWLIDGTPALMHHLWYFPLLMKPSLQLSYAQKLALVKARILKRENYYLSSGNIEFDQRLALEELNKYHSSYCASLIIDDEIDLLDTVLEQRVKALNL